MTPILATQEVRPTAFVAVPRVWEKFKDKIESQLKEASGLKEFILEKARVSKNYIIHCFHGSALQQKMRTHGFQKCS